MWDEWCVNPWYSYPDASWTVGVPEVTPMAEDDGWIADGWSLAGAALAGIVAYEGVRRLIARGQDRPDTEIGQTAEPEPSPGSWGSVEPTTPLDADPAEAEVPDTVLVEELISLYDLAPTDALKRRVVRSLAKVGVSVEEPAGGTFDSDRHDILGTVRAEAGMSAGTVVQVLKLGFVDAHGRVLRAAEVVVATNEDGTW